ncbi:deoxyuridine 5'-triphosphatenucleotidohydrolase [Erwinia phage PhiEaH1]|uniref:dUTP diphosphatase n=1 Tax=Erwinia phage PhiEaH1 TaxID=1401669 RepID=W8CZY0_9CAUD|nr:deoxyuridine 5'-triphosphatenucleotidohydrolase [Erwinia phage PhiEaH1]AGX01845.1 deoxyuridine 5'-triphosphatenucleotidohydrolase [Erwinia phage PhiEaH1]
MSQKTPDTLTAEIMACCPVTNPDTRPMYFTAEEKKKFTTFVQEHFSGTSITPGVTFEDEGNNLIKVVTVLLTEDRTDPIGANFSPVVIHHWLAAQEKNGEDENEQTRKLAGAFLSDFSRAHETYPVADVPYALTQDEMERFYNHMVTFFEAGGRRAEVDFQTGPDGLESATVLKVTVNVFDSQKQPLPLVLSAAYVRAWLNEQLLGDVVNSQSARNVERNCISVEVKVLDQELYWGKEFAPRGSEDAAGIDLMAAVTEEVLLEPGETKLIPTGLAFFLKNPNYVGLIHPRSGLGHKHGIVLGNLTGVIDADYNGQLMVSLWNRNTQGPAFKISRGDRIAQYLIQPVVMGLFKQVDEFSTETERGAGGFGSSGAGQEVMRGTMVTDGKSVHVHSEKPLVTSLAQIKADTDIAPLPLAQTPTFGERMNEARPRVFKKEGVFTKEEMAANMDTIMANLQVAIDLHNGMNFVAEELREDQLESVIKWALEFIDGSGGDSSLLKIVVERTQDWNHEAGQLFNRRANMNLFYTDTKFVRITHPACTFILKTYVSQ